MKVRGQLKTIYRRADGATGGRLGIVRDAFETFGEARGAEAAAGMAYYAMFSLFPLLLALVAAGSFVLDRQAVMQQAVQLVSEAMPISQGLIRENLQQVLELRGAVGLIGLLGAVWSATGVFTILSRHVNRAWTEAEPRNFLENRLVGLGMVGILALLLALSLVSGTVLNVLSRLELPIWQNLAILGSPLWTILSTVIPWLFIFFLFLALYRWVPNAEVPGRAAFWASIVVAVVWEIAANAFAWYVGSGIARYRLVYGSLGAIVALMFWIYLSSWITIFGAHLAAAIARKA